MEQMNSILSWNNPAPIIVRKDKQLRTFCPIVLFHEHTYKNDNSIEKCVKIHTGDEHHGEFIRSWKKRVDEMLQMNSRDWKIIAENSKYEKRLICREDHMPQSAIQLSNTIYSHHTSLLPQDQIDLTMKPKRRRGNLPKAVTALLKDWLSKHKKHPYPTEEEKLLLSKETKLSLQQISNWFINARRRHLPHLLENELSMNNSHPAPELDIYPYEAAESAEDADRLRCSSRVSNKTGGIKKPKPYGLQHKRKTVTAL